METRANYFIVGLFTLLGLFGIAGGLLWLAKIQVDQQYDYYDIYFESSSGLSNAGDVRYNGVQVGQVVSIGLDPDHPGRVRVRVEVADDTPVNQDTISSLEFQGVTGVSFVSLYGGTPQSKPLAVLDGQDYPVISSELSAIQDVFSSAPELLNKAIGLLENVRPS